LDDFERMMEDGDDGKGVADRVNVNIGILGHIDSGKTETVRKLTSIASTASFDRHPQSIERGITIDIGFSCFSYDLKVDDNANSTVWQKVQVTLVDCPGHASLMKTVLGACSIIDAIALVIDATKLIQAQTAECLALIGILFPQPNRLIVILNKIDLLPSSSQIEYQNALDSAIKTVKSALKSTCIQFVDTPIIPISALNDSCFDFLRHSMAEIGFKAHSDRSQSRKPNNSQLSTIPSQNTSQSNPFILSIDHCFPRKGQGLIFTGTMLRGTLNVGDFLDIPLSQQFETRRVKSIEIFRTSTSSISSGDRAAVCLTSVPLSIDSERMLACSPGALKPTRLLVLLAKKIRFHKSPIRSRMRFHISVGHAIQFANVTFVKPLCLKSNLEAFYGALESNKSMHSMKCAGNAADLVRTTESLMRNYAFQLVAELEDETEDEVPTFALIELEKHVVCVHQSIVIGSRLDLESSSKRMCRLAFYGESLLSDHGNFDELEEPGSGRDIRDLLRIGNVKERKGMVDRIDKSDANLVVVRGLVQKQGTIDPFVGLRVCCVTENDDESERSVLWYGIIQKLFGKSGKILVEIEKNATQEQNDSVVTTNQPVLLRFCKEHYYWKQDTPNNSAKPHSHQYQIAQPSFIYNFNLINT